MRKAVILFLTLALCLALCACGGQPAEDTTSAETTSFIPSTGASFVREPLWRSNQTISTPPNTIEVWFKLPDEKVGRSDVLVSTDGDGDPSVTLLVDKSGHPHLQWETDKDITYDWKFDDVFLRTGQWTHLAIVRDAQEGRIHSYVNGQLGQTIKERYSADCTPARPYCIGGIHGESNDNFCTGEIYSVAIYADARTAEEITADMSKPGTDDLLMHFDMTAQQDGNIKDLSGNGNDLLQNYRWMDEVEPVTDYAYSFMVVGDTQKVNINDPDNFHFIYDYVADSIEEKNVKFVMGLGDITDTSSKEEWARATESIYQLDGKVPYSMARGNKWHDTEVTFEKAFPISKYADQIAGSFEGNMRNVYYTFEIGQVKYLVLVVDCSVTDEALNWADQVVAAHPDRNVIVTTHLYMRHTGQRISRNSYLSDSNNNGSDIWEKLVRKHENIVLLLCGHAPCDQIVTVQSEGDNGNTVTQMLLDPQAVDISEGSSGLLATFYFSEDGREMTVEYYSPIKKQYFMTVNHFTVTLDLVD